MQAHRSQTILRRFCRDNRGQGTPAQHCYHFRDLEGGMADHELPRESRKLASTGHFGEFAATSWTLSSDYHSIGTHIDDSRLERPSECRNGPGCSCLRVCRSFSTAASFSCPLHHRRSAKLSLGRGPARIAELVEEQHITNSMTRLGEVLSCSGLLDNKR